MAGVERCERAGEHLIFQKASWVSSQLCWVASAPTSTHLMQAGQRGLRLRRVPPQPKVGQQRDGPLVRSSCWAASRLRAAPGGRGCRSGGGGGSGGGDARQRVRAAGAVHPGARPWRRKLLLPRLPAWGRGQGVQGGCQGERRAPVQGSAARRCAALPCSPVHR